MNTYRFIPIFGILIAYTITSVAAEGPSFDCKSKELSSAEKLICTDSELATMDRDLAEVFTHAKALDKKVVKGSLPAEQRGWIKGRDDCWKASDLKGCIKAEYLRRTAELQAKYRILSPVTVTSYTCENNPSHQLIVSHFATKQPSIAVEHGDDTFYLFEDSKKHYQGRNETLSIAGDSVEFVPGFEAAPLRCTAQSSKKKTLDSSWDKDGDGLNDCEAERTCDHTVDYSKPRQ